MHLPIDKLPEYWKDETRLNVLFGPFRNRNVNPKDWDIKLEFWKQSINSLCYHKKIFFFNLHDLQSEFTHNGRSPNCLNIVFEEMVKTKQIVKLEEFFVKQTTNWGAWATEIFVKKPLFWSLNKLKNTIITNIAVQTFVCVEAVENHAKNLLEIIPDNYKNKVIVFSNMLELIDFDKEKLQFVLRYMENQSIVALREVAHETGKEPILLIKFVNSKKDDTITNTDVDLFMLCQTEKILSEIIENLENDIIKLKEDAKQHIVKGHRNMAKTCLRKKNDLEKRIEARANALYNVQTLISRVEDATHEVHVLKSYKCALESLRTNFKDNKLNEESVMNTMADIEEVLDIHNEIQSSLTQSIVDIDVDLEKELEELLAADNDNITPKPSNISPKPKNIAEDLEEKLQDTKLADLIKELDLPDVPASEPENISARSFVV